MSLGRTFTGTPGQASTSTGGPIEISADIDAVMTAINELAEDKLGMTVATDGSVNDTTKTIIYLTELASIASGNSGSSKVGYEGPVPSSATIKAAVDYIWGLGITGSSVPSDNSVSTLKIQDGAVTNDKLATDVKLGSLTALLTVLKANYTEALNEVYNRALTQSNPIEPDSVVSQAITVTTPLSTVQRFTLDITSDITGGAITITRDDGSSKPLEEPDGSAVTSLDIGIYDIVEKAGEFVLMSGINVIKYNQFITPFSAISAATETELINISGSGYIDACVIDADIGDNVYSLELEIDGATYFKYSRDYVITGTPRSEACGFVTLKHHFVDTPDIRVPIIGSLDINREWGEFSIGSEISQIASWEPYLLYMEEPIFFKYSCIVKYQGQVSQDCVVSGGVKA